MAKSDPNSMKLNDSWVLDANDKLTLGLSQLGSTTGLIITNICEYKEGDGRAPDEAIYLILQSVYADIVKLEDLAYELEDKGQKIGDLATRIAHARAHIQILDNMAFANGMKFQHNDEHLSLYFGRIEKLLESAKDAAENWKQAA